MSFKKESSGKPVGRFKGSVSTNSKLIRLCKSQKIHGIKIV